MNGPASETRAAGRSTVWDLFHQQARRAPASVALSGAQGTRSYGSLEARALRSISSIARKT